jgi:hypothetical protein
VCLNFSLTLKIQNQKYMYLDELTHIVVCRPGCRQHVMPSKFMPLNLLAEKFSGDGEAAMVESRSRVICVE